MTADFVDINNSRVEEQRQEMQKIVDAGHCPFCPENLELYHKLPIIKEGKFWRISKNQWPYDHTQVQLLAIYKTHAETLSEIDPSAGEELLKLFAEIESEYKLPGGAFAMRFGDTRFSAGSVKHIHAQLIVPDADHPDFQPVRFKIGTIKKTG